MEVRVFDAFKREMVFMVAPKRVVSLVPSDTLNLAAIGAGSALVGRTDYCELPREIAERVPSVGGTKNPRIEDILALCPDLVIANQEENTRSDLLALLKENIRVYISFPKTVKDGITHLAKLARIFRTERVSQALFRKAYAMLGEPEVTTAPRLQAFCPIWMKPMMTINGETYISSMMQFVGCDNVFADRNRKYPLAADHGKKEADPEEGRDTRYPRVTEAELILKAPDIILLPNEPYAFSAEDAAYFDLLLGKSKKPRVLHVDGKDLSWYGAAAIEGAARLRAQLQLP
jgi:ABC-type Fe3+-hydroxamate transport system substrate-binding protein